ncbi:uncharacterized protein LOC117198337 [Orcinus orca]|uniref:uncharacterized protein LOC117198337 n=1 Tax=Orcinus orca TaxID=9733 RepID=UPI002111FDA3|nr:uncharacterized protein LOC117198337 [Orcinus orca]
MLILTEGPRLMDSPLSGSYQSLWQWEEYTQEGLLSRIALTHHVEKRWRPHRVFSPQYFCRQATASRIPAHRLDQLPRPAAIKSLAESFSVASGVHDARARLLAGQWERGRRQQGRQPPKRPSRPGPAPSTPYPRPPSRPRSFPEGSRWGTAPGPALRPALDAGRTLATEPLLRSVGTHLGGRSQSDVHGRTVDRVGYCGGLGRTRADPVVREKPSGGALPGSRPRPLGSRPWVAERPGSLLIRNRRLFTPLVHFSGAIREASRRPSGLPD